MKKGSRPESFTVRTETAWGKRITDVTGDRREVKGKSYHRLSNLAEVIQVLGGRAEILSQIGASSWPHVCWAVVLQ